MQIYTFTSDLCLGIKAFTSDRSGANLPLEYAPWRGIEGRKMSRAGAEDGVISLTIRKDGYFLVSARHSPDQRRHLK
jgi:hypothetical protein